VQKLSIAELLGDDPQAAFGSDADLSIEVLAACARQGVDIGEVWICPELGEILTAETLREHAEYSPGLRQEFWRPTSRRDEGDRQREFAELHLALGVVERAIELGLVEPECLEILKDLGTLATTRAKELAAITEEDRSQRPRFLQEGTWSDDPED
jgi:hypothetical protein